METFLVGLRSMCRRMRVLVFVVIVEQDNASFIKLVELEQSYNQFNINVRFFFVKDRVGPERDKIRTYQNM